jgi:subfamily B ATP-binding cassette protein MsbA
VNPLLRLVPYFWPHRRKFYLSVIFAILVAVFWGITLSMTFLVVKVFLQGQTVGEWVELEIAKSVSEIDGRATSLRNMDRQPPGAEMKPPGEDEFHQWQDQQKQGSKLSKATQRLMIFTWVKTYIVPYLPDDEFDMYALILGPLLVASLLKGVCIFFQESLIGAVVELTAMSVRKECFRKTLKLDYQTLSLNGTPDLMARFTYDMSMLSHGLSLLGGKAIREPLKAVTCIVIAMYFSWQLTLMALLLAPIAAVVFLRIGRKLKLASRRLTESMSRIYKTLEETLASMKIVIAYNGARQHRRRFHRENKEYFAKAMKIVQIDSLASPVIEVMGLFAASLALLPGAYLVLRDTREIWGITFASGKMEVEHLSALYFALAGMIDPARKLSSVMSRTKRGAAAAERVFGLIDRQSLVHEPATSQPLPRHHRAIEFHKVNFSYARHESEGSSRPQVLEDVSLDVRAGEVIVIVGENGSGKSTLVNLLPRYYDPDSGRILVDGVDLRDVRLRDLRAQIGVVTQETLLFDESIYQNIRYGKLDATTAEIEEAAKRAHVTPFISQLPDGFQTVVGERGGRLSGGQRQRIALARAMLRDPAILILDEATSAIDATSARLIHDSLRTFSKGRTTFIITHSVSQGILDFVSRIVVMEQGRLIAAGPHNDVLRVCPTYQRLFRSQVDDRSRLTRTDIADIEADQAMTAASLADGRSMRRDDTQPLENERPHILPLRVGNLSREGSAGGPSSAAATPPGRRLRNAGTDDDPAGPTDLAG